MLMLSVLIEIFGILTQLLLVLLLLMVLLMLLLLLMLISSIIAITAVQQRVCERGPVLRARSQARVVAHAAQQILHVTDATGGDGRGRTPFGPVRLPLGRRVSRFVGREKRRKKMNNEDMMSSRDKHKRKGWQPNAISTMSVK